MAKSPMLRKFASLLRNTDGNFAMMAGIMLPVVFVAGSLAVDTTNALSMKTRLQNAADSAALATTSQLAAEKITESEAKAYAINFFKGQVSDDAGAFDGFAAIPTVTITRTGTGAKSVWKVEVVAAGSQELTKLASFMGRKTIDVTISGTSESARDGSNPLSMMLVLDRSGSMSWASGRTVSQTVPRYCFSYYYYSYYQCGTTTQTVDVPKIDVLKEAVGLLTAHLIEADPTNEYTRMGAVSYNYQTKNGDKRTMTWTKPLVTAFADSLVAENGTYAVDAMKWGYDQITSPSEVNAHFSVNGSKNPSKFIVFMTDGEHDTGSSSQNDYADRQTISYCDKAKEKGVTIFAVAFQAPARGKALLSSCSSGSSFYYDANSADDLTKAFKDIGEEAVKLVTRLTS